MQLFQMESEFCPSDPHRNSWFCRLGRWGLRRRKPIEDKEEGERMRGRIGQPCIRKPSSIQGPWVSEALSPEPLFALSAPEGQAAAFARRPFNISVAYTLFDEEKSNIVWTAYGVYTDGMLQSSTWSCSYSTTISSSIFSASYSVSHS